MFILISPLGNFVDGYSVRKVLIILDLVIKRVYIKYVPCVEVTHVDNSDNQYERCYDSGRVFFVKDEKGDHAKMV
jgi:hypothetical protein